MPPKHARRARPAQQQMLFQATHKPRSSAQAARRHGKSKARAPAETPTPSSSLPREIDLIDLRSSSAAPQEARDKSADEVEDAGATGSESSSSFLSSHSQAHDRAATLSRLSRSATPVQPPHASRTAHELRAADHLPELNAADPAFDAYWEVAKQKLRYNKVKPVHVEDEDRVQIMLRVFDLDPEYGPSRGMSRLARWARARELGLNPPEAVRAMLETKQGQLDLNKSVLEQHLF